MIDIPADLMAAAYAAVDGAAISGIRRDIVAVLIGQVAAGERDRVLAHVDAAAVAIRSAGDGHPETVRSNAAEALEALRNAIASGEAS